jgi:hypothetical protein
MQNSDAPQNKYERTDPLSTTTESNRRKLGAGYHPQPKREIHR